MENGNDNHLVTKANKLIEANYRLSVSEQRVIAMVVSQLAPSDEDFKLYRFKISELAELIDSKTKNLHERVKALTKELVGKVLQIREPDGLLHVAWLSAAQYYDGEGLVELSFDPKLKPYLLQLKERFTTYGLKNVVRLQSRYSVRIYELLKQYETLGKRTFELPELREKLGVKKHEYKRWQDFRRWVIAPAARELPKKTDISFSYKTRKKGRKIWYLDFTIRANGKARLSGKEISHLKRETTKCWNRIHGACGATWENHQKRGAACHWCHKFDARRAEQAGQLRLV